MEFERVQVHLSLQILLSILADIINPVCCLLVFLFLSLPVRLPIIWGLFQVHQLQLV